MFKLYIALLLALATTAAQAEVKLPAFFADHMVLQKAERVPVWGWARAGEDVSVTLGEQIARAQAAADGRWQATLNLKRAPQGPHELIVQGTNRIVIRDVLVGEVWIASGQSNMEWTLDNTTYFAAEQAKPANPLLREFKLDRNPTNDPQTTCTGTWMVASPETIGRFSAIGYYFSLGLQSELNVPVGVINTSFGGTCIEAWISPRAIASDAALQAGREQTRTDLEQYPTRTRQYEEQTAEWLKQHGRDVRPAEHPEAYAAPALDTSGWTTVTMPDGFGKVGLPDAGTVWLRRHVPISPDRANRELRVELGHISSYDEAFWNGAALKKLPKDGDDVSAYTVPPTPEGEGVLAVRIYSPFGGGGIAGNRNSFRIGNGPSNLFHLPGEWQAKVESTLPALDDAARASIPKSPGAPPRPQGVAASLFNGMVQPLLPYAIRGVIWYQGESNTGRAVQYRTSFPLLIKDWRQQWGQGDFPFYFCQLANFGAKATQPGEGIWAELREAQSATLALPHTGQAILVDIGEEADIHPRNKRDAGGRLARVALAQTYRRDVPAVGPTYKAMKIKGDKVRLSFTHAGKKLVARPLPETYQPQSTQPASLPLVRNSPGSELEGFAICGADRQWKWARAKIEGPDVVAWSPAVPQPVAVRYAWADNPTCNLYNSDGLPAVPFRTDDFKLATAEIRYPN